MSEGTIKFVSYFRRKTAATDEAGNLSFDLTVLRDGQPVQGTDDGGNPQTWTAAHSVKPRGPGDILGFIAAGGESKSKKTIARLEPKADCQDFEPNYFPFVEFIDPDFPWRYSLDPGAENRVMPWICLLVLSREELEDMQQQGIPAVERLANYREILHIKREWLPRVEELWASAHVQLVLSAEAENAAVPFDPADFIEQHPSECCSRIFCMRKLQPSTQYTAFLAPVYRTSLDAFLSGESSPDRKKTDTLWNGAGEANADGVALPIYYRWSFSTGEGGDFESLARQLKPDILKAGAGNGIKPVDMQQKNNNGEEAYFLMEGALAPLDYVRESTSRQMSHVPREKADRMVDALNLGLSGYWAKKEKPKVTFPAYGCIFKGIRKVEKTGSLFYRWGENRWANELNAEYRNRVAASFGALAVQHNQESYVEKMLEWGGEIVQANEQLRLSKTASFLNRVMEKKHLDRMSDDALTFFTAPFHRQIPAQSWGKGTNLKRTFLNSGLPQGAVSPVFRRISAQRIGPGKTRIHSHWQKASPNGIQTTAMALMVNWGIVTITLKRAILRLLDGLKGFLFQAVFRLTGKTITVNPDIWQKLAQRISGMLLDLITRVFFGIMRRTQGWVYRSAIRQIKLDAIREQERSVRSAAYEAKYGPDLFGTGDEFRPQVVRPKIAVEKVDVKKALRPHMAMEPILKTRMGYSLQLLNGKKDLTLDPILPCPRVDDPMYLPLSDISHEYILPGVGQLENNRVFLCGENPFFIQSYMAGINTAVSEEIIWRELPFNPQGTVLRYFWKPAVLENPVADISDIHRWKEMLGRNNSRPGGDPYVVLLVKADLIRRYPDTIFYALRINIQEDQSSEYVYWEDLAGKDEEGHVSSDTDDLPENYKGQKTYDVVQPIFRAELGKDIVLIGFPVTEQQVRDGQFYFILQEHHELPRFGLDVNSRSRRQGRGLTQAMLRAQILGRGPGNPPPIGGPGETIQDDDVSWNDCSLANGYITGFDDTPAVFQMGEDTSSATVAYRTYQKPVKVIMHRSRLVPEETQ